jgi:hypothetical protein
MNVFPTDEANVYSGYDTDSGYFKMEAPVIPKHTKRYGITSRKTVTLKQIYV